MWGPQTLDGPQNKLMSWQPVIKLQEFGTAVCHITAVREAMILHFVINLWVTVHRSPLIVLIITITNMTIKCIVSKRDGCVNLKERWASYCRVVSHENAINVECLAGTWGRPEFGLWITRSLLYITQRYSSTVCTVRNPVFKARINSKFSAFSEGINFLFARWRSG
jgi:hypothetical protein